MQSAWQRTIGKLRMSCPCRQKGDCGRQKLSRKKILRKRAAVSFTVLCIILFRSFRDARLIMQILSQTCLDTTSSYVLLLQPWLTRAFMVTIARTKQSSSWYLMVVTTCLLIFLAVAVFGLHFFSCCDLALGFELRSCPGWNCSFCSREWRQASKRSVASRDSATMKVVDWRGFWKASDHREVKSVMRCQRRIHFDATLDNAV